MTIFKKSPYLFKMDKSKILTLIILLGVIIRFIPIPGLTTGSISYNVGIELETARRSVFNWGLRLGSPDQAFLKYFILRLFLYLGRSEFIIRLPALIFGILTLFLIYKLGAAFFGINVGLLSAFLLSVSLWHIHHSCYAANYTLFAFLSLLSIFFLWLALNNGPKIIWLGFVISSVLAFYSFYPTILILFAETLWFVIFIRKNKRFIIPMLISLSIIAISILPAIAHLYAALQYKIDFGDCSWGWGLLRSLPQLLFLFGGIRGYFSAIAISIFLLGFCVSIFKKTEREKGILLFILLIIPSLFILSCTFLKINVVDRYFLFIYPFFIIMLSRGISSLKNKVLIFASIVLVNCSPFALIFSQYGFDTKQYIPVDYLRHYADFRYIADYLESNYKDGDTIVIEQGPGILATQYYLDKRNIFPVEIIKPLCGALPYYRYNGLKIKNFFGLIEYEQSPKRLEKIWRTYKRLWLIDLNHIYYYDKHRTIQKWIDENYSKKIRFRGVVIYLLNNEFKQQLTEKKIYKCNKMVCFLDCRGKIEKIVYPFQQRW